MLEVVSNIVAFQSKLFSDSVIRRPRLLSDGKDVSFISSATLLDTLPMGRGGLLLEQRTPSPHI